MMHNDPEHPEIAREMQDVESPPLRVEEAPHFMGRGNSPYTSYTSLLSVCFLSLEESKQ